MANRDTLKILVVDDDLVSVTLIKAALKDFGEVLTENSGAKAIIRAIGDRPDLILLDLHMPNIDGYEVLRQLRQHPVASLIPVACMSGDEFQESRTRAEALGSIGFLQKPLSVVSLQNDLRLLKESMNISMTSRSQKNKFVIAFNPSEKYRLLQIEMQKAFSEKQKLIMISLVDGAHFCDGVFNEKIQSQELVYLRIVPSLIAKFPFMLDLSPIVADLKSLIDSNIKHYHLFFDDPHLILGYEEEKNIISRFHALKIEFMNNFEQISFFCNRESSSALNESVREMAQVFCS